MVPAMIDLHSHILSGLDDGSATPAESLELARSAVADGIRVLAATPHVRDDYPTEPVAMEAGVAALRAALGEAAIPLELLPGGEVALERLDRLGAEERARFGLGGNPSYLLVEFPYYGWPIDLGERLLRLQVEGVTPVLAHPERNADVQERPERLEAAVSAGALIQVTAGSLEGNVGRAARRAARRLLALELVHVIASDAHSPLVRSAGLSRARAAVGDEGLAAYLLEEAPAQILAGEPVRLFRQGTARGPRLNGIARLIRSTTANR